MSLPPDVPEYGSSWKHLLQEGSVNLFSDFSFELLECLLRNLLEALSLYLPDVDSPEPQTFRPEGPKKI